MNDLIDKALKEAGLPGITPRERIIMKVIVKHITKYIDTWDGR